MRGEGETRSKGVKECKCAVLLSERRGEMRGRGEEGVVGRCRYL